MMAVVADTQHRRLREMSTATALKKLSDLHKMETDELYCQMIGMPSRDVVQWRVRVVAQLSLSGGAVLHVCGSETRIHVHDDMLGCSSA